jgi:hypothetical protein
MLEVGSTNAIVVEVTPSRVFPVNACVPVRFTNVSEPEGIRTVPVITPAAGCNVNNPLVPLPNVIDPSVPEIPSCGVAV